MICEIGLTIVYVRVKNICSAQYLEGKNFKLCKYNKSAVYKHLPVSDILGNNLPCHSIT